MKSQQEILARAVVLTALFDRCRLEEDKEVKSAEEKEQVREMIWSWLIDHKYLEHISPKEKAVFTSPAGATKMATIYEMSYHCEAVQPLLWTLGVLGEMTDYTKYDCRDYRETLCFGREHDIQTVLSKAYARPEDEIALQTEVAMLWHWRVVELGYTPKNGKRWGECITAIFGDDYNEVLAEIPQAKETPGDFLVGNKTVSELDSYERDVLRTVAYWRHHAFEWIMGDEEWDEVSTDT